jgi:hypothetical protein
MGRFKYVVHFNSSTERRGLSTIQLVMRYGECTFEQPLTAIEGTCKLA